MLYPVPTTIEPVEIDYENRVKKLVGLTVIDLIKDIRSEWGTWINEGYYLEMHLWQLVERLLSDVAIEIKETDPIDRYQLLLCCALPKITDSEKAKKAAKICTLKEDINWSKVGVRARRLVKALHHHSIIATLQVGDRYLEEYTIIKKRVNITSSLELDFHDTYAKLTYDTLRNLLRTLDHSLFLSQKGYLEGKLSEHEILPKPETYDQIVDGTIEFLKHEGVFIPVVIKTLKEQRDPYQLFVYVEDVMRILHILKKNKGKDLSETDVRNMVASTARHQDIDEQYFSWLLTVIPQKQLDKLLKKPFAIRIQRALKGKILGTGRIYKALTTLFARSSSSNQALMKYIVREIFNREVTPVCGMPLRDLLDYLLWTTDKPEKIRVESTLAGLKKKLTDQDKQVITELFRIQELIRD